MAYRGHSVRRGPQRRHQHPSQHRSNVQRYSIGQSNLPVIHVAPGVGQTVSSTPISNASEDASNIVNADAKINVMEKSPVKESFKGNTIAPGTEAGDALLPISKNYIVNRTTQDRRDGKDAPFNRSGRSTRRSRLMSSFPKPPTCRTIQVSRNKSSMGFYFELARKFLHENELIELSGMGMACLSVIYLNDLILESGYAVKDHIHTSIVKPGPDKLRSQSKPRIQIWMRRSDCFFTLATNDLEQQRRENASKGMTPDMSVHNKGDTSEFRVSNLEETGYGAHEQNSPVKRIEPFVEVEHGARFAKAEDPKIIERNVVKNRVTEEIGINEKAAEREVSRGNVGDGIFQSDKANDGSPESEKVEGGKPIYTQTDQGKATDGNSHGQAEDGKFTEEEGNGLQTFLARAARSPSIRVPIAGTNATAGFCSNWSHTTDTPSTTSNSITTRLPPTISNGATTCGNSTYNGMAPRNGVYGDPLSPANPHVSSDERRTGYRTTSGSSATSRAFSSGISSRPINRSPANTPCSRKTCTIGAASTLSTQNSAQDDSANSFYKAALSTGFPTKNDATTTDSFSLAKRG